jgi:hypothetical protein
MLQTAQEKEVVETQTKAIHYGNQLSLKQKILALPSGFFEAQF